MEPSFLGLLPAGLPAPERAAGLVPCVAARLGRRQACWRWSARRGWFLALRLNRRAPAGLPAPERVAGL
eukprot:SAG22_NODE_7802_length_707_cov_1.302632_1_plen_68_part_10